MPITLNGNTGIASDGGYTGDGLTVSDGAPAGAVTIDSVGNLGIGTSSPAAKLDVRGSDNADSVRLSLANNTNGAYQGISFTAGIYTKAAIRAYSTGTTDAGSLTFWTSPAGDIPNLRATIDSSGNLGLGVTPSAWGAAYPGRIQGLGWAIATPLDGGTDTSAFATNAYNSAGSTWNYRTNAPAALYQQFSSTHRWYTAPSGTAGNAISFTQAMTLNSAGLLGIGTTNPTSNLHVEGTGVAIRIKTTGSIGSGSTAFIQFDGSEGDSGYFGFGGTSNTMDVWNRRLGAITFGADNTERARITSSGNFWLATTTGAFSGYVDTAVVAIGGDRPIALSTSGGNIGFKGNTGGWAMGTYFYGNAGTYRGGFGALGSADTMTYYWVGTAYNGTGVLLNYNATSWSTLSDERDKTISGSIENAVQKLSSLRTVYYKFKSDEQSTKKRVGLIAQDVQAVLPEVVEEVQREIDNPTEETKRLVLSYTELIPVLVKAIQEQQAQIAALVSRVAALESN